MDQEITLNELRRLEAERKLRTIPRSALETAWAREAQIEAVIDAVLAIHFASSPGALAHIRHVGEWCARIATAIDATVDSVVARRVGVLSAIDPTALRVIPELVRYETFVREYQLFRSGTEGIPSPMSLIVRTADEFSHHVAIWAAQRNESLAATLSRMVNESSSAERPVVEALVKAVTGGRSSFAA